VTSQYLRTTPPALVFLDVLRVFLVLGSALTAFILLRYLGTTHDLPFPLHRRLWSSPEVATAGRIYLAFTVAAFVLNALWITRTTRNFVRITMQRRELNRAKKADLDQEKLELPPWPYKREAFTVILGELQARDGARVPSEREPDLKPRWATLPELAQFTGVFLTGGIGSGKTAAIMYPCLDQMVGFERPIEIQDLKGQVHTEGWKYSGLLLDEKGDFVKAAEAYATKWGREGDIVRIGPGGETLWNVIYNPNLADWAVGYQLGWIVKNFNKGAAAGDPFWERAPKELTTDYIGLIADARGYYNLADYLETLITDELQDRLHYEAMNRWAMDRAKVSEMERRWKSIQKRRDGMSVNLRGALEACAKAGIDMFSFPELRKTFCPTREDYFGPPYCPWPKRDDVDNEHGIVRPRENVFTGFDQALDYGKIVGLQMAKSQWFDAAEFVQVALKSQWQDSVFRRDAVDAQGRLIVPPRFGLQIGYCPTFMFADECQANATPRDNEFKAQCRSKRASCWEATQSHSSILDAFGPGKEKAAETYFQNSMTHIYLRQSDIHSMELIQKEVGLKDVYQTTLARTEGGRASHLSYVQGEFVQEGLAMSETKTTTTVEKPFVEVAELKQLPNNVAVILPSTGEKVLPATYCYLRPPWVFKKNPDLRLETPWQDWPEDLRKTYDLDSIPQDLNWGGWGLAPLQAAEVLNQDIHLGAFIQPYLPLEVLAAIHDETEKAAGDPGAPSSPGEETAAPLELASPMPESTVTAAIAEAAHLAHIAQDPPPPEEPKPLEPGGLSIQVLREAERLATPQEGERDPDPWAHQEADPPKASDPHPFDEDPW